MDADLRTNVMDCVVSILVGLGPILAAGLAAAAGWILLALLHLASDPRLATGPLAMAASLGLIIGGLSFVVCWSDARLSSPLARFTLLYAVWILGAAALLFVALWAIGGTSMAAVDGAIPPGEVRRLAAGEAMRMLLPAQVCIVPWVSLATVILHRRQVARASGPR